MYITEEFKNMTFADKMSLKKCQHVRNCSRTKNFFWNLRLLRRCGGYCHLCMSYLKHWIFEYIFFLRINLHFGVFIHFVEKWKKKKSLIFLHWRDRDLKDGDTVKTSTQTTRHWGRSLEFESSVSDLTCCPYINLIWSPYHMRTPASILNVHNIPSLA